MANTFETVRNHPILLDILSRLAINHFCKEYSLNEQSKIINENELKKASWLASILADSPEEKHQFVAASFAKLLYLQNPEDEQKTQLSYTILSRTGNLAAARHLANIYEQESSTKDGKIFKNSFGNILDLELGTKRNLNRIDIDNKPLFVTDFQRSLWDNLKIYDHVAISAPTSAGKSFFIQHFISTLFQQNEEFKAVYIIPSRALISQVSDQFKKILNKDVAVRTAFIDETEIKIQSTNGNNKYKKEIYCVTPERCLKLLQQGWKKEFTPDLIFIDEIQNVETNDNRAVLLEYILAEVSKLWKGAKILFAGPFINNGKELYKKLLEISGEEIKTYLPPVYQLRIVVQYINNDFLKIIIHLNDEKTHSIEVKQDLVLNKYSPNKAFLAQVIKRFGKPDGNLIYAARPDYCVDYAKAFVSVLNETNGRPKSLHPAVRDLIELLKEEIHPNYYLIYCLRFKVGFHHGKLPDIIKNEIEYLFEKGYIQYLFCTSTLLQGVNLPAPRMFIVSPKKESDSDNKLSHFEFGNLIGRAGRIRDSMIGTIFCLEKDPTNNSWANDYYNPKEGYTKTVIPTTEKALKENTNRIIETLTREPSFLKHSGEEYTGNLIKQKFIESPQLFESFLKEKKLDPDKISSINTTIENQLKERTIPHNVVRLNPSIDPVLQNRLYELIKADGIENWVLVDEENGNRNYKTKMKRDESEKLSHGEQSFYFQFERLLQKLDNIFALWKESYVGGVKVSAKQMAFYGTTWLESLSYSQLILKDLAFYKKDLESNKIEEKEKIKLINQRINVVIKINSVLVTYILVKYFKLLSDLLSSLMIEEQKEKYRRTLSIPTMLELGTRKIEVLIMVSMGIPRSIALKVSKHIPEDKRENPIEWLATRTEKKELPIKNFYLQYLKRKGYLPGLNIL
jgi:superfamily II DNA/RNA helicase